MEAEIATKVGFDPAHLYQDGNTIRERGLEIAKGIGSYHFRPYLWFYFYVYLYPRVLSR